MAYDLSASDDPTNDPLFYKGKTNVLGKDVEVRLSGQLPSDFPQAGPAPAAGPKPPTRPTFNFPEFPAFDFPGFSFSGAPTPPRGPTSAQVPFQSPQWWQALLASLDVGQKTGQALGQLGAISQDTALPDFPGIEPGGMPETAADLLAKIRTQAFSEGAPSGLEGGTQASIGNLGTGAGTDLNWAALAGPALQTAGGVAALAQGGDARSQALGGAQTAGGLAGLASQSGLVAGLEGVAPALALVTAPLIVGSIYEALTRQDLPQWPQGYTAIPGQERAAVDPATGAVLWYSGHGKYEWSPQTQAGQRATPQELLGWNIPPAGALLQDPAYQAILPDLVSAGRFVGADPAQLDPALLQLPVIQDALRANQLVESGGQPQAIPGTDTFLQYAPDQTPPIDQSSATYTPGGVG